MRRQADRQQPGQPQENRLDEPVKQERGRENDRRAERHVDQALFFLPEPAQDIRAELVKEKEPLADTAGPGKVPERCRPGKHRRCFPCRRNPVQKRYEHENFSEPLF
ncbi:hypothetical protein SDC9_160066 [bioreactor metagenome]|uniref:Uncharacterized protein n=1 Tax=bioreactor metagenome TaxID=1076179 RepID=A0A645FGK9_9ZZZZ